MKFEIEIFRIKDHIPFPKIAEDDEVIIRQKSDLKINEKVVIEVIPVGDSQRTSSRAK